MITEIALLKIRDQQSEAFETAFSEAQKIIANMKGYKYHELQKCIEEEDKYLLLVQWQTLEHHTEGFRKSNEYQEWKKLLHHFYDPFPTVEHYKKVF
ncbi:antibiotic biosynthesis monooxygenase [Segetibacter sp.]|jgi:heme-degrading monooxygenase HmoA|uniref:antibiotic biosynthesis monooxygenase family protein n=1 Tax=Segetibacter sp. TaxID=2231182 RepID=UPI0026175610|nr:antibiotic biosynthesis monooxygenase [Segetibacter sp.]MCW3078983.1 antibiotic biosynthesis monooxygenase [Segetibacter sp.]